MRTEATSTMVLGYQCPEHGLQDECDVSEAGERICYECGTAMTGIAGETRGRRAPPSDKPMYQQGSIMWQVTSGYDEADITVEAFGWADAVEAALERVDHVRNVTPAKREYRH